MFGLGGGRTKPTAAHFISRYHDFKNDARGIEAQGFEALYETQSLRVGVEGCCKRVRRGRGESWERFGRTRNSDHAAPTCCKAVSIA